MKNHGGESLTPGRRSDTPPGLPARETRRAAQGAEKPTAPLPAVPGKDSNATPPRSPIDHEPPKNTGRPFWSGSLTIGLVNVPVQIYTMVRDRSFSFRLLHRADGQPLKYDRVCSRDGVVVPWADTVKGYEVRKGEFLVFEPDELKAVMPESDRKIRIDKFVFYLSLDPVYFENTYLLVPDRSEEAYSLLAAALQELGRAAAGTITIRTKEYPVVVHVYDNALVLTTLRHAEEVTLPHMFGILPALTVPKEAELALAKKIIKDLSGDFSITDYPDRYREAVLSLIDKKLAGEKIVYKEPRGPGEAKELMQALQETIATLARK